MTNTPKRIPKFDKGSYMFTCIDGPKTPPLRSKHLFGHLSHIEANNEKYRIAGPMNDKNSGDSIGSFFIVEADSEEEAWNIMKGDPYIESGMYETITVHHFVPACGDLLGGIIWDQDEIRTQMEHS